MAQPGIRATQIADLIRDHLAGWIHRDFTGFFVSVNQITLSPDIKNATAWITVYPENKQTSVLRDLKKNSRKYSSELRKVIQRHNVPVLDFAVDTSAEDEARISELLK